MLRTLLAPISFTGKLKAPVAVSTPCKSWPPYCWDLTSYYSCSLNSSYLGLQTYPSQALHSYFRDSVFVISSSQNTFSSSLNVCFSPFLQDSSHNVIFHEAFLVTFLKVQPHQARVAHLSLSSLETCLPVRIKNNCSHPQYTLFSFFASFFFYCIDHPLMRAISRRPGTL